MKSDPMEVAVTGAAGFVGRNLVQRLKEEGHAVHPITRESSEADMRRLIAKSEVTFHLAGANRPDDPREFARDNLEYTRMVAEAVARSVRKPLLIYSSTAKVGSTGEYARTKAAAEGILLEVARAQAAMVAIFRLPNLFGKWARPDYNSVVATFCHRVGRGLPIAVHDARSPVPLLYIDDLLDQWLDLMAEPPARSGLIDPRGVIAATVGEIAQRIESFAQNRMLGFAAPVGTRFERALYATYVSYLPPDRFSSALQTHLDSRGAFTEVLKMESGGQVSCLTAHPGVTRGGHYHHSKVERFFVAQGRARFRFRHVVTGDTHEVEASAGNPCIVETAPGWAHDVTNIGNELLIAIVWSSELFDPDRPDTFAAPL